jgi:iron complex outermembrane recepter protein
MPFYGRQLKRESRKAERRPQRAPGVKKATICCAFFAAAPALTFAQQASSQSSSLAEEPQGLAEIVVSAQRREENLQDVPISVMALSADELQQSHVTNIASLSLLAPSINFNEEAGWSEPHLRGIGTTATGPGIENSVALYVDGVYHAAMIGGNADLSDVQDVEVINGPQGTLFGRNATGGLIQIRTKDPSHDFGGQASVGYGNYNTANAGLYVTGGLTDTLAANFSVDGQYQGEGYGRNVTTGEGVALDSHMFARAKLLYTPIDNLKVLLAVDYGTVDFRVASNTPPGSIPLGGGPVLAPQDTIGPVNPAGLINEGGGALTVDYDAGAFHVLSTTAYRITDSFTNESPESTTSDPEFYGALTLDEPHRQFSQEFQLSSPSGRDLTWTTGAYYFHETAEYNPVHLFGGLFAPVSDIYYYTRAETNSYALYGQATYAIEPKTHVTAGVRYTYEQRSILVDNNPVLIPGVGNVGPPPTYGSKTFSSPSWRLSLDHRFSDDVLGYVSYNRGFKSGGWNAAQVPAIGFSPEKLDAYEIGIKSSTADHRLQFNASPFFYKYTDMQVESFPNAILLISNGASSQIYGIDLDANALLTRHWRLHAGATLLHATFTSYPNADLTTPIPPFGNAYSTEDAAGHHIPLAPAAITTLGMDYTIPSSVGEFTLNGTYSHNSGWWAEPDNRLKQPAYELFSAQLSWVPKGGVYEVDLWGKNLANESYALAMFTESQGDVIQYAPPRTFGIRVKATF